jgi:plastocyanin
MKTRVRVVAAMFLPGVLGLSWPVVGGVGGSFAAEAATCAASGNALAITALDNKFDKDCLAAPPDQAFTIELDNQDSGIPHNVSIYDTANGNTALFTGEVFPGPQKMTYQVPAQPAGTYEFRCDPHAEFMRGTFVVG